MIVQCEQCQTRFKIPDEKVTEKGVKVRCTKCQNTFRVAREPAPAPSAPPPAGPPAEQPDPFQAFGDAPEPTGEVTRPGAAYYAPGAPAVRSQVQS
ncbi:zinc-ribbon domain-containing protein, partial [Corallococcus exiguus]